MNDSRHKVCRIGRNICNDKGIYADEKDWGNDNEKGQIKLQKMTDVILLGCINR
jgi:hypothetical protein